MPAVLAALLLATSACGHRGLEPWHEEELEGEFRAGDDEVTDFEAYASLEEALFEELDEEVYSRVGTGPDYALVRFSPGSAADPRRVEPDWNRSYEWSVDAPVGGVLLLHGLTDSPYSLRALGKVLHAAGFHVLGLRFPGHGTAPSGLLDLDGEDLVEAARIGLERVADRVGDRPVHVIGYSLGATVGLRLALDALDAPEGGGVTAPATLTLISPAIGIHPAAGLARWKRALSEIPGLGGLAWLAVQPEFDPYKYNSFPTNGATLTHRQTRNVARRVAERARREPDRVLPPTLVFKSAVDATVSTDAVVDRLLSLLAPGRHELVLFDVNRAAVRQRLIGARSGRFTDRLTNSETLPFDLTVITNGDDASDGMVARHTPALEREATESVLDLHWPRGVISLSHVALPFPPDDPVYGQSPPEDGELVFLGQLAIKGERGLLRIPSDWLIRLRHNPFWSLLAERTLEWLGAPAESSSVRRAR